MPESTDPQQVLLAPAQWDRVDALSATTLWAIGVVVLAVVAFLIWSLSSPPRFGLRR